MITLLDKAITAAETAALGNVFPLVNAKSIAIQCNFAYTSGGTTAKFYVQTSLDGGTTWIDIACFAHTTASLRRVYNLSSLTAVTSVYTATDGTLTDNTSKGGIIGNLIRVKYTTVGTYAGTSVKITAVPK